MQYTYSVKKLLPVFFAVLVLFSCDHNDDPDPVPVVKKPLFLLPSYAEKGGKKVLEFIYDDQYRISRIRDSDALKGDIDFYYAPDGKFEKSIFKSSINSDIYRYQYAYCKLP